MFKPLMTRVRLSNISVFLEYVSKFFSKGTMITLGIQLFKNIVEMRTAGLPSKKSDFPMTIPRVDVCRNKENLDD